MESKLHFDFKTTQELLRRIGAIDLFKGKWSSVERADNRYLKELKKIATIESAGASTRIEGATLTDEEVAQLIRQVKITQFQSREEEDVFGYYETLDLIFESYADIPLTENNVRHLHKELLKFSSKDQYHRGNYKTLTNKVVANYPDGLQRVIFNTTQPALTPKAMSELIAWTNERLELKDAHPLIVAGAFVYEFLSVHPFQDGNGRLSRLLTTLLLLQQGYDFVQYVSFEHLIEERKKAYYQSLMSAQQFRNTEKEIIDQWMLFFIESLESLVRKLEVKYAAFKETAPYLNDRQRQIRAFITEHGQAKIADVAAAFPAFSIHIIKKDAAYLIAQGVLEKMGEFKGTVYKIKKT